MAHFKQTHKQSISTPQAEHKQNCRAIKKRRPEDRLEKWVAATIAKP